MSTKLGLYAIYDQLAGSIIGGVHLHKHDAPAVRFFNDVAEGPNSQIARHPEDFVLLRIGLISEDGYCDADRTVILEGKSWADMRAAAEAAAQEKR